MKTRAALEELALRRQATELAATAAEIDAINARIADAAAAHDKAVQDGKPDVAANCQTLIADLRTELAAKQSANYLALKAEVDAAKALIASFDQYTTAMAAVPDGQKYPPVVAAALRDVLHEGISAGDKKIAIDRVLYLSVDGAGGDLITRTGLFSSNKQVGLVGAVQVTYLLVDPRGPVKASGTVGESSAATFDLSLNRLDWQGKSA